MKWVKSDVSKQNAFPLGTDEENGYGAQNIRQSAPYDQHTYLHLYHLKITS